MNINSSLVSELNDKQYRDGYVASQIRIGLPFQIRALRKNRGWNQAQLAEHSEMAQPRISEIEKPGCRNLNVETLLRIASAFDVGLDIRFVPFSKLIESSEGFDPDSFSIHTFTEEIRSARPPQLPNESISAKEPQPKGQTLGDLVGKSFDWSEFTRVFSPSVPPELLKSITGFDAIADKLAETSRSWVPLASIAEKVALEISQTSQSYAKAIEAQQAQWRSCSLSALQT